MKIIAKNEQAVIFILGEKIKELFPDVKEVFIKRSYPDLFLKINNNKILSYEIEYKLCNFLNHNHHNSKIKCNGIIYLIDDRREDKNLKREKFINKVFSRYDLIQVNGGRVEIKTLPWILPHKDRQKRKVFVVPEDERLYKVSEIAKEFNVDKKIVYKWLQCESVIDPNEWIRLPSGQIRIKAMAFKKLKEDLE